MGQDDGIYERARRATALDLNLRHLSVSELEAHHKRKACLDQYANETRAMIERARTLALEERAHTALHQPNNGTDNTHSPVTRGILRPTQPKHRPRPLDLATEDHGHQQSLGARLEQRGCFESGITDHESRVARMGLSGQKSHGEGAIPLNTFPRPILAPTNHHVPRLCTPKAQPAQQVQERSKAQPGETPTCGETARETVNDQLLKARIEQAAMMRKLNQQILDQRKLAQQKFEQPKLAQQIVRTPTARPRNLHPGPSRISGIPPPSRNVHDDGVEQRIMSKLAHSTHIMSKMASQEAYQGYKEKKRKKEEEKLEAALSVPTSSEATRMDSYKKMLASVSNALEQKVGAELVEGAKTEGTANQALQTKGPEGAYKAGLKCGESCRYKYDKSHLKLGQSGGIHRCPNADCASVQQPGAIPDHPASAKKSARHIGTAPGDVRPKFPRESDFRYAVEAIDKTSGNFLRSPKTASYPDEAPLPASSTVPVSQNGAEYVIKAVNLSLCIDKEPPAKVSRQDVCPTPSLLAGQTGMSSDLREDGEIFEDAVEAVQPGDLDIQSEWEEVEDSLGGDGWSDVEQDLVNDFWMRSSDLSDTDESEGVFDC